MKQALIVDDDEIVRNTAVHLLKRANYDVLTACNGVEALNLIREKKCQIVVTDWHMPGMDGLNLCRAIRQVEDSGYVYIVILTASDRPEDTMNGLRAGADDFIIKPFHHGEFVMRVNTGLRIISLETKGVAIFTLAKLAESRDPDTGAHLERVRNYCRCLSEELMRSGSFPSEIDAHFIELIYETSPLHDIGKVAIPDNVLLKPGPLTSTEFEIMKGHTLVGATTLQAALDEFPHTDFLQMARDIALSHHERYDGTGYPHGLSGSEIPLAGRILAVADVYDALTSKRVYKAAYPHEVAARQILSEAGTHFDPVIVRAFAKCQPEFANIRASFVDQ